MHAVRGGTSHSSPWMLRIAKIHTVTARDRRRRRPPFQSRPKWSCCRDQRLPLARYALFRGSICTPIAYAVRVNMHRPPPPNMRTICVRIFCPRGPSPNMQENMHICADAQSRSAHLTLVVTQHERCLHRVGESRLLLGGEHACQQRENALARRRVGAQRKDNACSLCPRGQL